MEVKAHNASLSERIYFFYCFCFGAMPDEAQASLLALQCSITHGSHLGCQESSLDWPCAKEASYSMCNFSGPERVYFTSELIHHNFLSFDPRIDSFLIRKFALGILYFRYESHISYVIYKYFLPI